MPILITAAAIAAPQIAPQVDLRFERRGAGPTFLARQLARYPFHVGRVLRRADAPAGAASVLLQSCSGGLFEHDCVAVHVKVCRGAGARVGNAAATVVHSMRGGSAVSLVRLEAEPQAWLEYLPALSILFPQAQLQSTMDIVLHPHALVIVNDAFLAHAPPPRDGPAAAPAEVNEPAPRNHFAMLETCISIRDETQRLLVRDRVRLSGALWCSSNTGVAAGYVAQGTLLILNRNRNAAALADLLRAALATQGGTYIGVGTLPNHCGIMIRILADSGETLRQAIACAVQSTRQIFGLEAPPSVLA